MGATKRLLLTLAVGGMVLFAGCTALTGGGGTPTATDDGASDGAGDAAAFVTADDGLDATALLASHNETV